MMKITGLSHLFKWKNLHNWWLTKYFFAPLYLSILMHFHSNRVLYLQITLRCLKVEFLFYLIFLRVCVCASE